MLLPKKWAWGLGLLAAAPALTFAGPFDFAQSKSAPAETAQAAPARGNQEVANEIAKALSGANLTHKNVQIEYKGGVARITGQIKDANQKALVTNLARRVAGVDSVQNDLQVMEAAAAAPRGELTTAAHEVAPGAGQSISRVSHTAPASNQQVAQQVAAALQKAGLGAQDIEVRYKDGAASLIGRVEDAEQVRRAEFAARSVPGVQHVINRLTPASGVQPVSHEQAYGVPGANFAPGQQVPFNPQTAMAPQFGAPIHPAQYAQPGMVPQGMPPQGMPPYGNIQPVMGHQVYNQPYLPNYAWPSYAQYDNYAAVTYPKGYDASAWPYIGPYYPYPQVPMEWRQATLEWDDGYWNLKFNSRTDKWWWFLNPKNWD